MIVWATFIGCVHTSGKGCIWRGQLCASPSLPRAHVRGAAPLSDGPDLADEYARLIAAKCVGADTGEIKKKDRDVDAMVIMFEKGELNLFPKFQRSYTWNEARASRLMVTALCGRTIPPIFLHEKKVKAKGKLKTVFDVVDGKQRLSSLIAFRLGAEKAHRLELPPETIQAACKLAKLDPDEFPGWNGMRYEDLSEENQRTFDRCDIITLTIPASYSDEQIFTIYEDINSGSDNLSAQQLRRAVFHGPYMELIDSLRENADFLRARCANSADSQREADGELVLRLLAFGSRWREHRSPRKVFLNDELRKYEKRAEIFGQTGEQYLADQRAMFERTMRVALRAFGEDAVFRRWDATKEIWGKQVDPLFAELVFAALHNLLQGGRVSEAQLVASSSSLIKATKRLFLDDDEFNPALRSRTAIDASVRLLEDTIIGAVGGPLDARRAFTFDLVEKRALWERQGQACTICGELIRESDLADGRALHVDHMLPHARGGATDDTNAALVHAACNLAGKGEAPLAVPSIELPLQPAAEQESC